MVFSLTITNIGLVVASYPYDFFFRIKSEKSDKCIDTPKIQAYTYECQEQFPWRFQVEQGVLSFSFIELFNGNQQVIRAVKKVELKRKGCTQKFSMIGNRTGKKVCIIQCIASEKNESKFQKQRNQVQNPPKKIDNRIKQEQKNQKREREQKTENNQDGDNQNVSKQLQKINIAIERMLEITKKDHQTFNAYLKSSSNLLTQLNKSRAGSSVSKDNKSVTSEKKKKKFQEEQLQQEKSLRETKQKKLPQTQQRRKIELSTQTKFWYKSRYRKQIPKQTDLFLENLERTNKEENIILQKSIQYAPSSKLQYIYDINLLTCLKPTQLLFFDSSLQKINPILLATLKSKSYLYKWEKPVYLPVTDQLLIIEIKDTNSKIGHACLSKKQKKQKFAHIFDKNGTAIGEIRFNFKQVEEVECQTTNLLEDQTFRSSVSQQEKNNEVNKNQQDNKKRNMLKISRKIYEDMESLPKLSKSESKSSLSSHPLENKQDFSIERSQNHIMNLTPRIHSKRQFLKRRSHTTQLQDYQEQPPFISNLSQSQTKQAISLNLCTISTKLDKIQEKMCSIFLNICARDSCQKIVTEQQHYSKNLLWKSDSFLFSNICQFSQLKIEVYSVNQAWKRFEGSAKISLLLLDLEKTSKVNLYHEYIRNEKNEQVGQLLLGYQSLQSCRNNNKNFDKYSEHTLSLPNTKQKSKRKRKLTDKLGPLKNRKIGRSIGKTGNELTNLNLEQVKIKRYTGRNITIGRAHQFKNTPLYKDIG